MGEEISLGDINGKWIWMGGDFQQGLKISGNSSTLVSIRSNMDATIVSPVNIPERQMERFKYLNALFDWVGGRIMAVADAFEVGNQLGFDRDKTSEIVLYLHHEGLVIGGPIVDVELTHRGVKEIEAIRQQPSKPTDHFPANIIVVQNMTNSQILQASPGASQTLELHSVDLIMLQSFLNELTSKISGLNLNSSVEAELSAEIASLHAQLTSPHPKGRVVAELLRSFRNILEGCTGSLLAAGLLSAYGPMFARFMAS